MELWNDGFQVGMMEQWNCGMMGFKKTELKAHNFALIFLF
jgi:hypothetical protein